MSPAQASTSQASFVVASGGVDPCEPGHDSATGHCQQGATWSPYASIEADLTVDGMPIIHFFPLSQFFRASRAIAPSLQPPQSPFKL